VGSAPDVMGTTLAADPNEKARDAVFAFVRKGQAMATPGPALSRAWEMGPGRGPVTRQRWFWQVLRGAPPLAGRPEATPKEKTK